MTEAEWLAAVEPQAMFEFAVVGLRDRKKGLYLCGLARSAIAAVLELRGWQALHLAEEFADGLCSDDELDEAHQLARDAYSFARNRLFPNLEPGDRYSHPELDAISVVRLAIDNWYWQVDYNSDNQLLISLRSCQLLRDVFGNPFRPVAFDSCWRSSSAVGVAQAIYDDRAFDRLPILADALQDAGCEDADVLSHCRGDGPHVRGCWVVDRVLRKE